MKPKFQFVFNSNQNNKKNLKIFIRSIFIFLNVLSVKFEGFIRFKFFLKKQHFTEIDLTLKGF